jgi:serine/threonine protein phosphatase PrpC
MEIKMSNKRRLHVSIAEDQGSRSYMEDATAVHFEKLQNSEFDEFAAFAVYDGHGGPHASFFARVSLTFSF